MWKMFTSSVILKDRIFEYFKLVELTIVVVLGSVENDIMRNHICQNHTTLQLKLKKQLAYNYYTTIPWVLQLLCNYPLRNTVY
jgi:hypothetical protein